MDSATLKAIRGTAVGCNRSARYTPWRHLSFLSLLSATATGVNHRGIVRGGSRALGTKARTCTAPPEFIMMPYGHARVQARLSLIPIRISTVLYYSYGKKGQQIAVFTRKTQKKVHFAKLEKCADNGTVGIAHTLFRNESDKGFGLGARFYKSHTVNS